MIRKLASLEIRRALYDSPELHFSSGDQSLVLDLLLLGGELLGVGEVGLLGVDEEGGGSLVVEGGMGGLVGEVAEVVGVARKVVEPMVVEVGVVQGGHRRSAQDRRRR